MTGKNLRCPDNGYVSNIRVPLHVVRSHSTVHTHLSKPNQVLILHLYPLWLLAVVQAVHVRGQQLVVAAHRVQVLPPGVQQTLKRRLETRVEAVVGLRCDCPGIASV